MFADKVHSCLDLCGSSDSNGVDGNGALIARLAPRGIDVAALVL
jgi:hypothetical protein